MKLSVFDILGREVETLVNDYQQQGNHEVTSDGSRFTSGIYFYKIELSGISMVRSMMLVK